jgi:D-tagatose-1,6-bisphosphate aldolase subunit GatZ/KbaZ-like
MNKLERFVSARRCTLLGVGPVSKNCVDAAVELSNEHAVPVILIASRRQIEMEALGGGYVNNWSTERFAEYVTDADKRGKVILARDHGGPWQHPAEVAKRMSLKRAMELAKESFRVDIESGFEMLHIDPSVDIFNHPSVDDVLERVFELYEFCFETAERVGRKVLFEIGTDEQSGGVQDLDQFEYVLDQTLRFCTKHHFPKPTFIVAQTGTKVMETRNVGTFDSPFRMERELPIEIQLPRLLGVCERNAIWLKEHNADYLCDESLRWHPKLGVHAVNIAPEYGVVESRTFLDLLEEHGLADEAEAFVDLVVESKKWTKWMLPESTATRRDMALIAGHYLFACSRFLEIKQEAQRALAPRGVSIDAVLKGAVKGAILRHLKLFNLLELN